MGTSTVQIPGTLEAYFFEQVTEAREESGCGISNEVEAYLVRLLSTFAKRPEVAGRKSAPLALELLRAREVGPAALREVGDRALFVAGVVPRSLSRGTVNRRYVSSIGEVAYHEVFQRVRSLPVFEELAEQFGTLVEVLEHATTPAGGDAESLLEVYERWRRERTERDARILVARGVLLDPDRSDIIQ